ncbi:MAG: hypothetical protein WCC11_09785 [Gammaproteobacteria bacterium]
MTKENSNVPRMRLDKWLWLLPASCLPQHLYIHVHRARIEIADD